METITLEDLEAELATHGKTCDCAHKGMCEDREAWLIAEIDRLHPKPVRDPFFENMVKLPPRREVEAQLEKWKRRALAFHEGYKDKSFEVTALEIQLMDLRAYGADKVTARQNESLRAKNHALAIERNEAKARCSELEAALRESRQVIKTLLLTQAGSHVAPGFVYELYAKGHEIIRAREVLVQARTLLEQQTDNLQEK